ncbi:MAG TPA: TonB-dependent receptor [Candidatus Saccharimonadales bacterium]|nr:TonB-dependent receptor [Candidatus Saccharimonadales bacterium]
MGASGTIQGSVADSSGAVVSGATVQIQNRVTNYQASTTTDGNGQFVMHNVPFNRYHVNVSAPGFAATDRETDVNSQVAVSMKLTLNVASAQTVIEVQGGASDLLESGPTAHVDVDRGLIERLPQSGTSGLSSVIQQTAPGVVTDSNGLFHPLGEHSDTSFVIDNQPVSDQQSRTFSNQIATSTINSMEVISGVAPAEFGDKASLVVRTSTKSGLGTKGVHGGISGEYGSFGTASTSANLSEGNDRWGNFTAIDGINSGRFLDTPEFRPLHARGNSENLFNRSDYQVTPNDTLHLNLSLARTWFQVPNDYDQQATGQDQRQQLRSFNLAPGYNHQFSESTLLSLNTWVRQDRVGYYPSSNPLADQPATMSEQRRLTSTGIKTDLAIVHGRHNFKAGVQWQHTFLSEFFQLGITDPTFNDPAGLTPFDLTRGGSLFSFRGRSDVKEESVYVQDSVKLKNLTLMGGVRADIYNGISSDHAVQPRVGASYLIARTGTVLRASYGRLMLTPYNENLVLSSATGSGGLSSNIFGAEGEKALTTAHRNEYETGVQQGFGKYLVMDASYFWKYTNGDYDFDVLLNTPLSFPIQWKKSKIDGVAVRLTMPAIHGWSAYSVMGHTRSRFFGPESGGILFNSPVEKTVFRIDHDQAFQQNSHVQYQFGKNLPWVGFSWNYESGMVAGNVPDYATALGFTADQQAAIGLFCGSTSARLNAPIRSCASGAQGATRINIPPAGTENDDRNPPRIAPRHVFDVAVGDDNLFRSDKQKVSVRFTVSNLTNKVALYNFLSTFSGTHFLSPRTYSAQLGYSF